MTKGELKSQLDSFDWFPDDMPISINVGVEADNIAISDGKSCIYVEGWEGHEKIALSQQEDDLFGNKIRGAAGTL